MTTMRAIAVCLLLAGVSSAQIVALHFADQKAARKYKKYLQRFDGEYVIPGEIKSGITLKNGKWTVGKQIQLYVPNRKDPLKVPYKIKDGVKVPSIKSQVLSISRDVLNPGQQVTYFMRDQTLIGLAQEYRIRQDEIAELEKERDALDKTSREWMSKHGRIVGKYERFHKWLENTCFPLAAKQLEKKVKSSNRKLKDDALKERAAKARGSVKKVELPEGLQDVAKGTGHVFGCQESQHIRIIYNKSVSHGKATELLKLGETIIEGFRREFIDAYLDDEDIEDYIPEDIFYEVFFGPEDVKLYEKFWNDFYGRSFGQFREQSLKMSGTGGRFIRGVPYVRHWKSTDRTDHEGCIAHNLGHILGNIHFNSDRSGSPPDWLEEGLGYYLSFEYLGRNSVTCKQFKAGSYDHNPGEEGHKSVQLGQRAVFNEAALKKGPPLDTLAQTELYSMTDPDLAKSWSMFDYIARKEGKKGVLFLQAMCEHARSKQDFIVNWREDTERIFELGKEDPLKAIDDRWKEFAKTSQKKDDKRRRRR